MIPRLKEKYKKEIIQNLMAKLNFKNIHGSRNFAKVKEANMIKKHKKATKENKGGIFDKENFIHLSNLRIIENNKQKKNENKK